MNSNYFTRCSSVNYSVAGGGGGGMEAAVTGRRRTTTHAEEEEAEEEEEEDDEEEEEEDALVTANPAIAQHPAIAPFRYLINEQAKSFVVLQELQNEVGALLEFRDLVMETFPHLRQKSVAGGPRLTAGAPTKQRDWEPGVRVKRKLHQLHSRELQQQDISLAAPPRSRSNSHGKAKSSSSDAAANSGTSSAGSSAVQDSGFCADSSKEHCSTSAASSASSAPMRKDADDELWNLLDMIHVKGTRLRLQVEHLQQKLDKHERVSPPHAPGFRRRSRSLELISTAKADHPHLHPPPPHHPPHCCPRLSPLESEMRALRQERDMLLDRIADMEAENLANVARSDRLLAELSAEKRHLQRQLRAAAANSSHRQLLVEQQQQQQNANRYHSNDIGVTPLSPDYLKQEDGYRIADTQDGFRIPQRLSSTNEEDNFRITERLSSTNDKDGFHISQRLSSTNNDGYRIRPTDPVSQRLLSDTPSSPRSGSSVHRTGGRRLKVGALDGIVSSPSPRMKGARDVTPDKKKTAAILAEFNAVELQRHLLVTTFQNQIANSRIERLSRSYVDINHQLEKFKEENDDLRFQLEEKSIELEGTRARIRLLERLQSAKFAAAVDSGGGETLSNTLLHPSNESTPNPILPQIAIPAAAVAATAEEAANAHHSSSTESAHHDDVEEESCGGAADVEEGKRKEGGSPKKRPAPPPSKIPLKSYTAPKPPAVSRTPAKVATPPHSHRSNEKLSLGGVGSGGSRSKSRDSQPAQQPRSRDRTTSPATGRESLRRPRKLSAQEASFSSTGSSHSTPRTPHSYSSLKKARGAASAAASAASEGGGGEHKKTTQVVAKPEPERLEKTEEFVDSLDNESGNQELDRSMSSVAPSRNWRHSPQSRLFFDSIDNTNNNLNQSLCLSAREAMADSDSLEPSCSDLV